MKKGFRFGWVLAGCVAVAAGGYVALVPKIGHASEAEIMAALPASLKAKDVPDPAGESRYARLTEIVRRLDQAPLRATKPGEAPGRSTPVNEATLSEIERLLREGGLRVLELKGDALYPELTRLKDAAKLMGLAAKDARERDDRRSCGRWVSLGLRFARALKGSGGVVIHQLVAVAIDSIAIRSAYLAEIEGGLDARERAELLTLLPPQDGRSPAMAAAVRRDFQQYWMPVLLDPKGQEKELIGYVRPRGPVEDEKPEPSLVGTYDPLATARLGGAVYDATITDLNRTPTQVRHDDVRLAEGAAKGLPEPPDEDKKEDGFAGFWSKLAYRVKMNAGHNTLGRIAASQGVLDQLSGATARAAANHDLLRAVILLRTTGKAAVSDPYTGRTLRFDPKRKVVWSAGRDGKDDGGEIGRGFENAAPDLGYPYGDDSWHPERVAPSIDRLAPPLRPEVGFRNMG